MSNPNPQVKDSSGRHGHARRARQRISWELSDKDRIGMRLKQKGYTNCQVPVLKSGIFVPQVPLTDCPAGVSCPYYIHWIIVCSDSS